MKVDRQPSNSKVPTDRRKLILLGASKNSVEILDLLEALERVPGGQRYECVGILDDNASLWGTMLAGTPILGPLTSARDYDDVCFLNGIGSPASFWRKDALITSSAIPLERFTTLVHPAAHLSRSAVVGAGAAIFQNATLGSNVRIGKHVLVCPNALLSHDCTVGDFTCIAGGASMAGGVHVGRKCYVGMGSVIRENVKIGDGSLVGLGSVVVRDVLDNSIVFGNPARFHKPVREIPIQQK